MKPGPLSIYPVGLALLGVFGAAVWALSGESPGNTTTRLTAAAKQCGFEDPRFVRRGDNYLINEPFVSGGPNPPVSAEGQRQLERSKLLQTKLMPCLDAAAKSLGVRVGYEKTVMVN